MKRILMASLMAVSIAACSGENPTPIGPDIDTPRIYPDGPFGVSVGDTIKNLRFFAFLDTDGDGVVYNDDPSFIELAEFYAENDPEAKIIMLNAAAGWCPPCMAEAQDMPDVYDEFYPRGVRMITAVFENPDYSPATTDFVQSWGEQYELNVPLAIDSQPFQLGPYFDEAAMPTNIFIDATTMEILEVLPGYSDVPESYYYPPNRLEAWLDEVD
jgi:thiol-disulfide isomerase/thioredoxin